MQVQIKSPQWPSGKVMACRTYTPSSIPTHALRNDFFLKNLRDIHFDEYLLTRISSKCSVV